MRQQLTWQNTATPNTANRIVCWNNAGAPADLAVDALVINPTASEDGYVLAWNQGNQEYELVPNAGGGVTADNGVNISAGNIQLGGPLTENTTITGGGGAFDLFLGTNADKLDTFLVTTDNGIGIADGTAGSTFSRINMNLGAMELQVNVNLDIVNNIAIGPTDRLVRVTRNVDVADNDIPALLFQYQSQVLGGNPVAGFGLYNEYALSNSTNFEDTAMIEEITWADPTDGANYANYRKYLRINDVVTEVMSIVTSSSAPNVIYTLQGLLNLPDLPTSSAGLAAGTLWSNAGILTVA